MRTKNVQATLDESDLIAIPKVLIKNHEKFLLSEDVLVSSANSWNLVGKCCQAKVLSYDATAGAFLSILRPTSKGLNANYLYRWFSSTAIQRAVRSFANQTTNISNLDHKRVVKLQIPLPPLPEQKRIAQILDAADVLRAKRRESIAQLDALVQSTFLEMFGDPVTNSKHWPIKRLEEVGKLDRGVSKHRPRNAPELLGGPYPLIQTGDVAKSGRFIIDAKFSYSETGLKQSKLWPAGTLCITIAANIADTAILKFDACFPDSVVGFSSDIEAMTPYVQSALACHKRKLEQQATQVAQKNINLKVLRGLTIPLPPSELLKKYS